MKMIDESVLLNLVAQKISRDEFLGLCGIERSQVRDVAEALALIRACAHAEAPALKRQAEYRLSRVHD